MPKVVVVGGGFAGAWTARALGRRADVVLVSTHNYLLFTPMLAEVAAADLDPRHILTPLRQLAPDAGLVVGSVTTVDPATRSVVVRSPIDGTTTTLTGDAIVLAAGSQTATFGIPGVEEHTLGFRTIGDALAIRHRLLALLEAGPGRGDETTVAVIGAGASGAELACALADFLRRARRAYYPASPTPQVTLVDMSHRVLPQLPERASQRATRAMTRRGVALRLGTAVSTVEPGAITLADGSRLEARTIVWAGGVRGHPVPGIESPRGPGHRLEVDGHLRLIDGVWALGDIARAPDGHGGVTPPTAQHAIRQGVYLGKHLPDMLAGHEVPPFRYRTLGELVSLGHRSAVGKVLGITVSGHVGWFLWRSYYLLRLPGMLRRLRVAFDWTLDLVFPPDIVDPATADPGPDLG